MVKKIALNDNFINLKVAHRGLHSDKVSENSLNAYSLAVEKGFAIEIDIHLLKDGELAVVHDSNLKRLTGFDVVVEDLNSTDLSKYPLLIDGQDIPLFKDVLKLVNGKSPLLIELKVPNKFDHRLVDIMLEQLNDYPYTDKVACQSFNPFAVKYTKEKTDKYSVGFLCSYKLENQSKFRTYILKSLKLYKYMHADFISYDINYLPNKYVDKKRKKGVQVLTWTINTYEKLEKAKTCADNIIFEKIDV
ncbi:MAG TPA: hypothetical protein DCY93_01985 [Firmicutes bacterium]|nr:hypothetical protein [Bacillota bacterium]